jgi:hypothetical protein
MRTRSLTVWAMAPSQLYQTDAILALGSDLDGLAPEVLADAAVVLDNWHRFAVEAPEGGELPEAAVEVLTEFEEKWCYNTDPNDGRLIPGRCTGISDDPGRDRSPAFEELNFGLARLPNQRQSVEDGVGEESPSLATLLLYNTTWLPPEIACGHPDDRHLPDTRISPAYCRIMGGGRTFTSDVLRLAIAPLAETACCATFVPTHSGASYTIVPQYGVGRLLAALENALKNDADILMMPEMTVNESELEQFGKMMRDAIRKRRKKGDRPRLAYVFIGIISPAVSGNTGANYLQVIDTRGLLTGGVWRQDKICRWNLTESEQARFGFDRANTAMSNPIKEDIDQSKLITVFDIDGFGRLICLICASVDHNRPADWLAYNVRPDWIYVPVMDSSTCWTNCRTSPLEKWTIRRAYRAACISRGRVVVANSMSLQDFENKENQRPARANGDEKPKLFPQIEEPGICFAIDRRGQKALFSVSTARIPVERAVEKGAITEIFDWGVNWSDFDEEIRAFPRE